MTRSTSLALWAAALAIAISAPLSAQIPTEGLVAYYPFNGNANDESGNGNDGVVHGATLSEDRFANPGSAYDFDGLNDLITVANSTSLQSVDSSVTLSAWVYVEGWDNTWCGVVAKSNTAARGQYGIAFQPDGRIDVDIAGTYISFFTSFNFTLNRWYFLCFTWDGEEVIVYVNGNIVGNSFYSPNPSSNMMPLEIGRHTPTNTEYMNGKLDDIRIYDNSLSQRDVYALYHENGWLPFNDDLLAFYPFNGNAEDLSGNENHGTLLGGATANRHLVIHETDSDALSLPYTLLDGLSDFTFSGIVQINSVHTAGGPLVAANAWLSGAASFHPGGNGFNITYDGTVQGWRILIVPPFQVNYFFDEDNRMEDLQTHHVVVSRAGNEARLYLDGSMVGNPLIVPTEILVCDPGGFIVGQDQDYVGGGFDANQCLAGGVDNLRIFGRALTEAEVLEVCYSDGIFVSAIEEPGLISDHLPQMVALRQNYPNPFNPTTTIVFDVPREQHVKLSVYNILGEVVASLVDETVSAGTYSALFDARGMSSGTYFYRMETGEFSDTKRLVVLK